MSHLEERDHQNMISYRLNEVLAELSRAESLHEPFKDVDDAHEVLLDQFSTLEWAIGLDHGPYRDKAIHDEAVQVAAMALRFLIDVKYQAR